MFLLKRPLTHILGDATGGLFGSTTKPREPLPKGWIGASPGLSSPIFASFGLFFALRVAYLAMPTLATFGPDATGPGPTAVLGLAMSYLGFELGRKGDLPTRQGLLLAKYGVAVSMPCLVICLAGLAVQALKSLR